MLLFTVFHYYLSCINIGVFVQCVEMLALACLLHASLTPMAGHTSPVHTASGKSEASVQYVLHLEFDYARRDRRQRDYILDSFEYGQVCATDCKHLPVCVCVRVRACVRSGDGSYTLCSV